MLWPDTSDNSITTAEWTISYDGENLADNSIDVSDLAPTLLSIRQLCLQTNEIVNGEDAIASLRIRTTRPGSFEVELVLVILNVAVNVLSGNVVSSAANLKQLLIGNPNVLGVFGAFKRLRGRPFRISDDGQDVDVQDTIILEAKDLKISVPLSVSNVLGDSIIQKSLHGLLTPLKNQNMDEIVIRDGNREAISLKSEDFDEIEGYEDEISNTIDIPNQNLSVSAPSLDKPHNKWRLHDGQTTHWYSILYHFSLMKPHSLQTVPERFS